MLLLAPFVPKGADAQHRGDALTQWHWHARIPRGHPPHSPFLRKGEDKS